MKVSGIENVPKSGPIIFIANHPSTLLDPIVIGILMKRPIYFLAANEFMGKGLVNLALQKWFNMIPVFRPSTSPEKTSKNKDAFDSCYKHLQNDGVVLIFPEGSSVTANRLRTLKTGAARIALGAERTTDKELNVQIIPIGINYSDSHSFQGDVLLNIGRPVMTNDLELTGDIDSQTRVKSLTQLMENRLRDTLIHLNDERLDSIYDKVAIVANHQFGGEDERTLNLKKKFSLGQKIQEVLHAHLEKHPNLIVAMNKRLDDYLKRVELYGVSDASISMLSPKIKVYDYLRIVFGIPVFLFGFAFNAIPYYISVWLYSKLTISLAFRGSIGMSLSLVIYLIWYTSLWIIVAQISHIWWLGFLFVVFVYTTGRFTVRYLHLVYYLREKGHLRKLLQKNQNILRSLLHEREGIIKDIEKYSEIVS